MLDFAATHIGRLELRFESLNSARAFGPGGLQLPLRFITGALTGPIVHADVLHGTDWASITGAGLIRHRGDLLLSLDDQPRASIAGC